MKLSDITAKTKTVSFDYSGETVNMDVRTQLITPKLIADLGELEEQKLTPEALRAISEHIVRLVATWDVQEDDGSVFPLDVERLEAEIPVGFQMHVLMAAVDAMGEDLAPQNTNQAEPA